MKRILFLLHRWFGVALCALFALWFATGIVMMYVDYPELTEPERLDHLPRLAWERVAVGASEALAVGGLERGWAALALTSVGERPAYRMAGPYGERAVVFADDGTRLEAVTAETAVAVVRSSGFATRGPSAPRYDGLVEMDQWTVTASLDEHRPLHRVRVGDAEGTVVYVSSTSGQIVRDTHRRERFWNWIGSTLHWIYPFQLRRHAELWTNLLIYLSLAGNVSVATGAIVGIVRLRLVRRYRGRDRSPYSGIAKWHHVLGLGCLLFLSTFIFSGLMSMTPWGLFDSAHSEAAQVARYTGEPPDAPAELTTGEWQSLARAGEVKEIDWRRVGGRPHWVVSRSAADREVMTVGLTGAAASAEVRGRIEAAVAALVADASIVDRALLTSYDDYYYSRHNRYRPLPAYRVRFDDEEATWFYIDWTTGAAVLRYTTAARVQRWLYNGLHSLDFGFLLRRGVLWDATLIVLCLVGSVFAATAVVVGWRRVRRSVARVAAP